MPRVKLSRTFGDKADPIAAYTNSLILNDKVYVPLFNCDGDNAALETWRKALPGYTVRGYSFDSWMDFDALHCRSRALFRKERLNLKHVPIRGSVDYSRNGFEVKVVTTSTNTSSLSIEAGKLHYRTIGVTSWIEQPLVEAENFWTADIKHAKPGAKIQYYLTVESNAIRQSIPPMALNTVTNSKSKTSRLSN